MGRPHRIDPEHGIHHVYSRGTRRWVLFHDDVDRQHFWRLLGRVARHHELRVLSYCLMDNHFHLVVQCPQQGLSHAMRDLKSVYARWYNERHNYSGPVFEARFGSKLVTSYGQLRQLVRYVHRNPYAMTPALTLAQFRWSSHPVYLGTRPAPEWLMIDLARELFSNYQQDVETPIESDAVQNHRPLHAASSVQVPGTCTLDSEDVSLADILVAVARVAGCDVAEVHPRKRNGLIGIAILIARDAGFSSTEMAEPFGYRTSRALEVAGSRARSRVRSEPRLQAVMERAKATLLPTAA